MDRKADAGLESKEFITEIGFPEQLTIDSSKEQNTFGTDLLKIF